MLRSRVVLLLERALVGVGIEDRVGRGRAGICADAVDNANVAGVGTRNGTGMLALLLVEPEATFTVPVG